MGVVNVLSQGLTNRDASPRVLTNSRISGGHIRSARGVVAIASGDSANSTYRVLSLPSDAVMSSVRVSAPDIGTTTAADIGLYRNTTDGGAVVAQTFFKAGFVLNAGPYLKVETLTGNTVTTANAEQPLWQLLGLTADPMVSYDLVLTLSGAADAAGSVLVEADYLV